MATSKTVKALFLIHHRSDHIIRIVILMEITALFLIHHRCVHIIEFVILMAKNKTVKALFLTLHRNDHKIARHFHDHSSGNYCNDADLYCDLSLVIFRRLIFR